MHIDEDIVRKSIFKGRIIHGFLSGSFFSKVFSTIWPGNGTIYLSQTMNFIKPMYTNQKYISKFEIIEVLPKNKFWVMTTISDTNKEITIDGKALIKILQ
ncbi:MAG: enoyl-CoA hydratase [Saprospiraceae bacterium]|nr:enoyl-CoA hydratase [Saprospiraceae bacterium]